MILEYISLREAFVKIELDALDPAPKRRWTDDEFDFIFRRANCFCLDVVIVKNDGIFFVKREIEPFKDKWTLPGCIVRFKEPIDEAFDRLLLDELGVKCVEKKLLGCIQHLDDGPWRSSVSLAFLTKYKGKLRGSAQGRDFAFLDKFGEDVQPFQAEFFRRNYPEIMKISG